MSEPKQPPVEFVLTLRAIDSPVPPVNRMRALLKAALRSYQFRCMSVREVGKDELPTTRKLEA